MTLRVLVVDDDFMVAKIHRKFVEQVEGFEVVGEARSGAEALAAADQLAPDLVLLDIYLPDMSGIDVLRTLRGAGNQVDVLVVTAARDVDTVQQALRGGVVQYLIKPFTFEAMRERLLDFERSHRSVKAVERVGGEVGQDEVDAIFSGSRKPSAREVVLPKGLAPETLKLVAGALRDRAGEEQPTWSAAECAEQVGLARVSVRRYLEHLVGVGLAEVSLRYGAAGRPERRYRWTGPVSG
ncbi:MAG TPA: response regulator [Nocardioidaceae bacterium]|nr:response regulator [Nocardioidaceae bacterium]